MVFIGQEESKNILRIDELSALAVTVDTWKTCAYPAEVHLVFHPLSYLTFNPSPPLPFPAKCFPWTSPPSSQGPPSLWNTLNPAAPRHFILFNPSQFSPPFLRFPLPLSPMSSLSHLFVFPMSSPLLPYLISMDPFFSILVTYLDRNPFIILSPVGFWEWSRQSNSARQLPVSQGKKKKKWKPLKLTDIQYSWDGGVPQG